jgi:hypothetical protein
VVEVAAVVAAAIAVVAVAVEATTETGFCSFMFTRT